MGRRTRRREGRVGLLVGREDKERGRGGGERREDRRDGKGVGVYGWLGGE